MKDNFLNKDTGEVNVLEELLILGIKMPGGGSGEEILEAGVYVWGGYF